MTPRLRHEQAELAVTIGATLSGGPIEKLPATFPELRVPELEEAEQIVTRAERFGLGKAMTAGTRAWAKTQIEERLRGLLLPEPPRGREGIVLDEIWAFAKEASWQDLAALDGGPVAKPTPTYYSSVPSGVGAGEYVWDKSSRKFRRRRRRGQLFTD